MTGTPDPVLPPAMIGILGGGQLGRYFVVAARAMGYRTMVLEPDPHAPAGAVADVHLIAAYDDAAALATVAAECAVVTTEFENPPSTSLARLAESTLVRPTPGSIEITQDRRSEKQFLQSIGVQFAPYTLIETEADLVGHGIDFPALIKTARLGYDGRGQVTVNDNAELAAAWTTLHQVPCVLEQRLVLDREVSVVLARGIDGNSVLFPVATNVHVNGILDISSAPHRLDDAGRVALAIADALDYVGVLAVEMFVVGNELVVNELAPRPHNSGHWTLDAAATSQFEQQVRAVCGLTLGDSTALTGAAMVNLLGDLWADGEPDWAAALGDPRAHLHLYGKREPRPGRKMGHLTVLATTPGEAAEVALTLRAHACGGLQLDL